LDLGIDPFTSSAIDEFHSPESQCGPVRVDGYLPYRVKAGGLNHIPPLVAVEVALEGLGCALGVRKPQDNVALRPSCNRLGSSINLYFPSAKRQGKRYACRGTERSHYVDIFQCLDFFFERFRRIQHEDLAMPFEVKFVEYAGHWQYVKYMRAAPKDPQAI
jgi:hypothetical protein